MFCAGCGTQIQSGLNYCSRCGRRVAEDAAAGRPWTNPMVIAGQTAGVGFVAYIFVLLVLSRAGVPPDVFKMVTVFYFLALFGLCFMFLRQAVSPAHKVSTVKEEVGGPAYISPVTTAQLRAGFETPASVTDHTTRTLDEIPARKL